MNPEEAPGGLENVFYRLDPVPVPGEGIQPFEGLGRGLGREVTLSFQTAEAHSTGVPHQAIIPGSLRKRSRIGTVASSSTSKGTRAELSQNFTGRPCARREGLRGHSCLQTA